MGVSKMTRRDFNKATSLGVASLAISANSAVRNVLGANGLGAGVEPQPDTEWTMERGMKEWKPMTRTVAHVGVPGYEWQTGVLWDGSLVFGPLIFEFPAGHSSAMEEECAPLGNNFLHLSVGYGSPLRFMDCQAAGNPGVRHSLEEGELPIPRVRTNDGDLVWDEGVFAHLLNRKMEEGMQPKLDDMLIVHARFTVRNTVPASRTAHLWLHFGNTSRVRYGYKTGESDTEVSTELAHRFEALLG